MPSYKTHSIHGELILPEIEKDVEIKREDIKTFCIGPDTMIATDYKTFSNQHVNSTRLYFETLLKMIKENKLQDNSEVMAYLYGQLDHYILDIIIHPLIFYYTEDIKKNHLIKPHGLVEHWIDDYVSQKYNRNDILYYHKWKIDDRRLKQLVDELYRKVYGVKRESSKYNLGIISNVAYDTLARRNMVLIAPLIIKMINLGDILYRKKIDRVLPYLNLEHNIWINPETNEELKDSFDDLWKRSIEVALETIDDVNKFVYGDKELTNPLILNDTSYNTGLPCEKGQSLQYVKKYKRTL